MQLTKQQRVLLVTTWMRSESYQVVSQEFSENFPERNVPNKTTIWKLVKKYHEEGTKRTQSKLILKRGLFNETHLCFVGGFHFGPILP